MGRNMFRKMYQGGSLRKQGPRHAIREPAGRTMVAAAAGYGGTQHRPAATRCTGHCSGDGMAHSTVKGNRGGELGGWLGSGRCGRSGLPSSCASWQRCPELGCWRLEQHGRATTRSCRAAATVRSCRSAGRAAVFKATDDGRSDMWCALRLLGGRVGK